MLAHFPHRLLGAESNEHTQYYDPDFLEEVALTVNWVLTSVNIHMGLKVALSAVAREWSMRGPAIWQTDIPILRSPLL
ncbi:MAG: hypothetical protein ABI119_13345 [Gemmatimonadaceae bacterium]